MNLALCLPWHSEPCKRVRDAVDEIARVFNIRDRLTIEKTGIADARDFLAHQALATTCDAFLWVDADIIPRVDIVYELRNSAKNYDVVSANYWKRDGGGPSWFPRRAGMFANGRAGGIEEALVGFGCVITTRQAFRWAEPYSPLAEPMRRYFAQYKSRAGRWLSEDWAFCDRVFNGGGKAVVDTSVTVGHLPREPEPIFPPLEWECALEKRTEI